MISFDNTEIAFSSKSDQDLNRAYWLFKVIGNPTMVKLGKPLTNFALALHLPIKGLIKKTIFKQFCGGETIPECRPRMQQLAKSGVGTILDYSVEGKTDESDFDHTVEEIIATLDESKRTENIPFAVFKVTGITRFGLLEKLNNPESTLSEKEKLEKEHLYERVDRICKRAHEVQTPVFIDAEESWIQDAIDRISYEMMAKYNRERAIVFNTVQIYRHDRLEHLKKQTQIAQSEGYLMGVKLVRGAYMEKERKRAEEKRYPSPIQPNKIATDRDFNDALRFMINHLDAVHFCAGSHNEESNLLLTELMKEKGLDPSDKRVYFAQLLGMSDHISFNLTHEKFNVAKYVPYGPVHEVMPYLLRRADENTSVAGQTGRELTLNSRERARRRSR
ncbi:MAG: proline dehydrogenase family protein [Crocinitomicaceae bacterium]|jgi:proline dehydrogenase|nr:proline dehydrogenase family protein [Crocinitomicaceae bacterium]